MITLLIIIMIILLIIIKIFLLVIIHNYIEIHKSQIFTGNRGKTSIYIWTHLESSKRYVKSVLDLYKWLLKYYSPKYLDWNNNVDM